MPYFKDQNHSENTIFMEILLDQKERKYPRFVRTSLVSFFFVLVPGVLGTNFHPGFGKCSFLPLFLTFAFACMQTVFSKISKFCIRRICIFKTGKSCIFAYATYEIFLFFLKTSTNVGLTAIKSSIFCQN
jgi:uncharacterized membrane protein (GlpM family)